MSLCLIYPISTFSLLSLVGHNLKFGRYNLLLSGVCCLSRLLCSFQRFSFYNDIRPACTQSALPPRLFNYPFTIFLTFAQLFDQEVLQWVSFCTYKGILSLLGHRVTFRVTFKRSISACLVLSSAGLGADPLLQPGHALLMEGFVF